MTAQLNAPFVSPHRLSEVVECALLEDGPVVWSAEIF